MFIRNRLARVLVKFMLMRRRRNKMRDRNSIHTQKSVKLAILKVLSKAKQYTVKNIEKIGNSTVIGL